jgi:hypothetical protein
VSSMVFEEIFAFHMGIGNNLTYFMVILNVQWFQSISITYQVSPVFFVRKFWLWVTDALCFIVCLALVLLIRQNWRRSWQVCMRWRTQIQSLCSSLGHILEVGNPLDLGWFMIQLTMQRSMSRSIGLLGYVVNAFHSLMLNSMFVWYSFLFII